MERLKSGTGASKLDDARQAGAEAAEAASAQLDGAEPMLVLVYASVRYDLSELLAGVRSVTGEVPLTGCTTSGHFAGETVIAPGSGVGVMILGGGDYRFGVGSAEGMLADPKAVGAQLSRAAKAAAKVVAGSSENQYAAMVLFTDGLVGGQQAVINGIHQVCGAAVPVVGGAAGDDMQMKLTSVFHNGQVLTDAAVGVWISSPRPITVTSAHGWKPVSSPILITRAEGALIHEIAGRPAGEVFHELATAVSDKPLETVSMWKATYALGLIEPDGSHMVRAVFVAQEGTISTFTALPVYSAVQLMTADPGTLLSVVDGVIDETLMHGDETVLLAFDCVGRMDILGDDYPDEVARINKAARGARCFGAYTYGEFARARGVGGVHNATLTALAL